MELNYFMPRADLRDYVRAYYYFSADNPSAQPMCAELGNIRILLDGAGRMKFSNGTETEISSAFLLGPTTGAYVIDVEAGTRVFGIGIRPRGWRALLGVDAAEAADRAFDLSDITGQIAGCAADAIRNAPDLASMAAAADQFITCLLSRRDARANNYPVAMEKWLTSPDDLDLDRLVAMMDVSRRQTDRVAKQFFGASPKVIQRKYRALRAADRIRDGAPLWSAAGDGFYDQSHFIKEFKSIIGVTPGQFAASKTDWINEVSSRRQIGSDHLRLASI